MRKNTLLWQVLVSGFGAVVLVLALWLSPALWAQAPRETAPGVIPPGMLKNYGAAMVTVEYEGTLYCLRHDFSQDKKD